MLSTSRQSLTQSFKSLSHTSGKLSDRDTVFADPSNFIVPIEEARTDLKRFEMVIHRVWQVALRERNDLKDPNGYHNAQNAGSSDTAPTKIAAPISSATPAASGQA